MNLQLRLFIAMFATLIGFGCASQDSVDVPATQYYTVANVLGGWDPHTEAW